MTQPFLNESLLAEIAGNVGQTARKVGRGIRRVASAYNPIQTYRDLRGAGLGRIGSGAGAVGAMVADAFTPGPLVQGAVQSWARRRSQSRMPRRGGPGELEFAVQMPDEMNPAGADSGYYGGSSWLDSLRVLPRSEQSVSPAARTLRRNPRGWRGGGGQAQQFGLDPNTMQQPYPYAQAGGPEQMQFGLGDDDGLEGFLDEIGIGPGPGAGMGGGGGMGGDDMLAALPQRRSRHSLNAASRFIREQGAPAPDSGLLRRMARAGGEGRTRQLLLNRQAALNRGALRYRDDEGATWLFDDRMVDDRMADLLGQYGASAGSKAGAGSTAIPGTRRPVFSGRRPASEGAGSQAQQLPPTTPAAGRIRVNEHILSGLGPQVARRPGRGLMLEPGGLDDGTAGGPIDFRPDALDFKPVAGPAGMPRQGGMASLPPGFLDSLGPATARGQRQRQGPSGFDLSRVDPGVLQRLAARRPYFKRVLGLRGILGQGDPRLSLNLAPRGGGMIDRGFARRALQQRLASLGGFGVRRPGSQLGTRLFREPMEVA